MLLQPLQGRNLEFRRVVLEDVGKYPTVIPITISITYHMTSGAKCNKALAHLYGHADITGTKIYDTILS